MRSEKVRNLTQGPIGKTLILFFLPILAGNLCQQLYNTADALIIAKVVGSEALAAVGGSPAQVINVIIGFFTALAAGAGVVVAQAYGAADKERVSRSVNTAVVLSVIFGALVGVLGFLFTPQILRMMKTPEDTMADAVIYQRIYFCGMIFNTLYNMGAGILRAIGDSKRPLYALVVCCFTNILLDILFVKYFNMSVGGAALATILSQMLSAIIVMAVLVRTKESYHVGIHSLCVHGKSLGGILRIGLPSAIQSSTYSVSNLIIQVALNSLGTVVVASWSMTGKVDGVYWSASNAMNHAIMTFVGQNYGAGRKDRIRKCARQGMLIAQLITIFLEAAILIFAKYGTHLLIDDEAVVKCTQEIFLYFVPYYILWTALDVLSGTLRGMGDTVVPAIVTIIGVCGVRLLWVALVYPTFHTVKGISLCYPVSWAITVVALGIYYFSRRKKVLSDKPKPIPIKS